MKYVARLQTNPSINRFLLKTAPLTLVQAGQSQTFSEKQVLTLRDTLNSLFSIKFEILWSSLKTSPWTQIHLHTPQLPHGSPVLTVFPLSVDQLLGNTVRLNSAYQLYSGGRINNLWCTGGQTEKSNGLFQRHILWITQTAFCWRMSDRGDVCLSGAPMVVVQNRSAFGDTAYKLQVSPKAVSCI